MKLIIAEKPTLARSIVTGIKLLGENPRKASDGNYYISDNYYVAPLFGHIFELYDVEEYLDKKENWNLDRLPFYPDNLKFKYKLKNDDGIKAQYELLVRLAQDPKVSGYINAGDADREGEILVREVIDAINNNKPVERLWIHDTVDTTIAEGMKNLENDSKYDNLANEGYARTYLDWIWGINLTRCCTVKSGQLLHVGRVINCIVKVIYDRDYEIANFKKQKFKALESKVRIGDYDFELKSKYSTFDGKYTEKDLQEKKKIYQECNAIITDVKNKTRDMNPPKLFSQTTLQNQMAKLYKMKPADTLDICQQLYQSGYISYPRTNSEYLTNQQVGLATSIIKAINNYLGSDELELYVTKQVFDDSKVEGHFALIPTTKFPKENVLSENEWKVYSTVLNRFKAVFCKEPYTVSETSFEITVEDEKWQKKTQVCITKGWTKFEQTDKKEIQISNLNVGDVVHTDFEIVNKSTKPKPHMTVVELNNYLLAPFKKSKAAEGVEGEEDEVSDELDLTDEDYKLLVKEGITIGTEATRADIIANTIKRGYITLESGKYKILQKGIYLMNVLKNLEIDASAMKTALTGKTLMKINRGEITIQEALQESCSEINKIIANAKNIKNIIIKDDFNINSKILNCPKCGGELIEDSSMFKCSNEDFVFLKNNKLMEKLGIVVNRDNVKKLVNKGYLEFKASDADGNKYSRAIFLGFDEKYPKYPAFTFGKVPVCQCPKCKKFIFEWDDSFSCQNKDFYCKKQNKFLESIGIEFNAKLLKELCEKNEIRIELKSSTGRDYQKFLIMELVENSIFPTFRFKEEEDYDEICKCPKCDGHLIEEAEFFKCKNKDFVFPKNNKLMEKLGVKINRTLVKKFCSSKEVTFKAGSTEGITNDVTLVMSFDEKYPKYPAFAFKKHEECQENYIGVCPKCKNKIYETSYDFSCINKDFAINKTNNLYTNLSGKPLTSEDAEELIRKFVIRKSGLKKKQGGTFTANIKMIIKSDSKYPNFELDFTK